MAHLKPYRTNSKPRVNECVIDKVQTTKEI